MRKALLGLAALVAACNAPVQAAGTDAAAAVDGGLVELGGAADAQDADGSRLGGTDGGGADVLDVAGDIAAIDGAEAVPEASADDLAEADATAAGDFPADAAGDGGDGANSGDAGGDAGASKPPPPTVAAYAGAVAANDAAALATWLAAYNMPVCDGQVCVFAIQAGAAKLVTLVGDWDGWQQEVPTATSPLAAGWRFATLPLQVTAPREYKVKLDGTWALDPSNDHIRFASFGPNSAVYPKTGSRLLRLGAVWCQALGNKRDLFVYLPAQYQAEPSATFPVLYWQDGFNVFVNPKAPFGSWDVDLTADALMANGEVAPTIFVGVDTSDRLREYVWVPLTYEDEIYEPKLGAYATCLVGTFKPLIDARFRTKPGPKTTAIAGSSLGGISAAWIAWHHWATFGAFASFSGAFWVGEAILSETGKVAPGPPLRALIASNPSKAPKGGVRAYLDSGDQDFSGKTCYGCDSWVYTDWTRNALLAAGWDARPVWDTDGDAATPPADLPTTTAPSAVPSLAWSATPPAGQTWSSYLQPASNLLSLVGHGHQHNEAAWKLRVGAALRWLLPGPAL